MKTNNSKSKKRCPWCEGSELYTKYHDREWGTPVFDDRRHFEFLVLESAQAGLSWITILNKRENYRKAYNGFDPEKVAAYGEKKKAALLENPGIVRNRKKIEASINNAARFLEVQKEFGSFSNYIWSFSGGKPIVGRWKNIGEVPARTELSDSIAADLKKRGFQFLGSTIVYSHLQATGIVNDHITGCFRYRELSSSFKLPKSIKIAANPIKDKDGAVPANIGFIDGHCDTITVAMNAKKSLYSNDLHLDIKRIKEFGAPVQIFAIYCDRDHLKNTFKYANAAINFFDKELKRHKDILALALSMDDINKNAAANKISAILSLEGAEPLEGKMENLEHFYKRGIRLITLTWSRENELGYGVPLDPKRGLKPFGKQVVRRMDKLGMIVDVSHLNEGGFWDVDKLSKRPYIASHSNAFTVTGHVRNLKDDQVAAIVKKGGVIGLNLAKNFLNGKTRASYDDIVRHLSYFKRLGAIEFMGLGLDLDGIDPLPKGFKGVSSIKTLKKKLTAEFGKEISSGIIRENFYNFLKRFSF